MAKEKKTSTTTTADIASSHAPYSTVETIVSALSDLEKDIDGMYVRVEEMKKRIIAHSNEEIEKLKQQIITLANEEAKKIVESAKAEAEAESAEIMEQAEKNLAGIKKNISSSFDRAVDSIVRTVLGDAGTTSATTAPAAAGTANAQQQKTEEEARTSPPPQQPAKIKRYTAEGKPAG